MKKHFVLASRWNCLLSLLILMCVIMLSGCTANSPNDLPVSSYVHNSSFSNGTLVEDDNTLFALISSGTSIALHTYEKDTMTKRIKPIEHVKESGELIGNNLQIYLLQGNHDYLYSMGHGGSGGIYRIDVMEGISKQFDFLPEVTIVDWIIIGDKAYFSIRDQNGYSLQSKGIEENGFSEEDSVELLRNEGYGEFASIANIDETTLILHEITSSGQSVNLYNLKTNEKKMIAENICADWSAYASGKVMVCQLVENTNENTELSSRALIIDIATGDSDEVIEMKGLYRPIAAGNKFILDPISRNAKNSEPIEMILYDHTTGELSTITLPLGCSNLLGGDSKYAYFWNNSLLTDNSSLMALDIENKSFAQFN